MRRRLKTTAGGSIIAECGNKPVASRVLSCVPRLIGRREYGLQSAPWMTGDIASRRWSCLIWTPHTDLHGGCPAGGGTRMTWYRKRFCARFVDLTPYEAPM